MKFKFRRRKNCNWTSPQKEIRWNWAKSEKRKKKKWKITFARREKEEQTEKSAGDRELSEAFWGVEERFLDYSILPSPIVPCVLGERDINTPWKIQMLTFKRLLSFGESHNWYLRFRRKSRDSQESLIWQYIVILLINVWLSNIYILIIDILTGFFSIDFARSHVLSSFSSLPSALLYRVYTSLVDRKLAIQLLNCVCLTFHSADPIDRFSFADKIA